jgi:serine phosphatase RsbU (regulator of sigma subunit)/ligand-binding sensor domain-containing protein
MNTSFTKYTLLLAAIILVHTAASQNYTRFKAVPYVKNFSPNQYGAHEQNFDIAQDGKGYMYFANFAGILRYDGQNWDKVKTKSGMRVLSLDTDKNGRVYAGGLYDFGYLKEDSKGRPIYISLYNQIKNKPGNRSFFSVHCIGEKTFFIAADIIYIYENGELTSIPTENKAESSFLLDSTLYVFFRPDSENSATRQKGLTVYQSGKFKPIHNASLTEPVDIQLMFSLPGRHEVFIGTSKQGFFSLVNDTISTIEPQVNDYAVRNTLTCGTLVSRQFFALGTLSSGVVITDLDGSILLEINSQSKLQNEAVNAVFTDENNLLWMASDNGISVVDVNSNMGYIDNGISILDGQINAIREFQNNIFITSNEGLFYLSGSEIKRNPAINFTCNDFISYKEKALIASPKGLYMADSTTAIQSQITDYCFSLTKSKQKPERFYVGQTNGFIIAEYQNRNIEIIETVKNNAGDILLISEDKKNKLLFLENSLGKIFIYSFETKKTRELNDTQNIIALHILEDKNKTFFSSDKGLYIYKPQGDSLAPFTIESKTGKINRIGNILYLPDSNFIFTDGEHKNLSLYNHRSQTIKQTPFLPYRNFSVKSLHYDKKYNNILIGGSKTLLVYNYPNQKEQKSSFQPQFTSISHIKNDSLLDIDAGKSSYRKIPFSDNSLQFAFTAPHYPIVGTVEFRSFLQGFDKDTSEWTTENYRQFTNLPDKKYKLTVQAKNEYGKIIGKSERYFEILTPIYRRWWAILIYLFLIAVAVKLFFDYRMKAAEKEKNALEAIVRERTEDIEKSKEDIEVQRDMAYKQRKEIIDSINYAQRIQRAVLPSDEAIDEMLGDHFVFFKPYEIVSGDFFWMKKIKNYVAVAAADCTGHGVPGAFMSMLGSSFLNELVTSRSLDNAAEILNRLRYKIKKSLHQEGKFEEQKDGMDISFYLLDSETLELQFSGAYNPLYIIRHKNKLSQEEYESFESNKNIKLFSNTAGESDPFIKTTELDYILIELKANRQPIGIYIKETDFTNTLFKLKKGDTLYNFSDGFVDQFGGETGSKFKTKRFKELLLSMQKKTLDEQKRILEQSFYRWKGNQPQIDDVIIIGYRV